MDIMIKDFSTGILMTKVFYIIIGISITLYNSIFKTSHDIIVLKSHYFSVASSFSKNLSGAKLVTRAIPETLLYLLLWIDGF